MKTHRVRTGRSRLLRGLAIVGVAGLCVMAHGVEKKEHPSGLFMHGDNYGAFNVRWVSHSDIPYEVIAVFPHLSMPARILAATARGLMLSEHGGRGWKLLPGATRERIGMIRWLAFSPIHSDTFYIATASTGVWLTEDGGKTVKQIGTKQNGLISDSVAKLYVFPGDRLCQTLVAVHGDAAEGLSRSLDAGTTWQPIATDYFIRSIQFGRVGTYSAFVVAAKREDPDVCSVFYAMSLDDYWYEAQRDILVSDHTARMSVGPPVFSTYASGVYLMSKTVSEQRVPAMSFTSMGETWGSTADTPVLYACDPENLSMVVSDDDFRTYTVHSTGLSAGGFVREGAHIRANAGGSAYFAAVNGRLYAGYPGGRGMRVASAGMSPPVFVFRGVAYRAAMARIRDDMGRFSETHSAARAAAQLVADMDLLQREMATNVYTLTATVVGGTDKPESVTCDLTRLGSRSDMPLFDDGLHGDGKAGDSVYGMYVALPYVPRVNDKDWRGRWPGKVGLTVTATAKDGSAAGAVAPFGIYDLPEGFKFYDAKRRSSSASVDRADVELLLRAPDGEAWRDADSCIKLSVRAGSPWQVSVGRPSNKDDITGYYALSFMLRADRDGDDDLSVQLQDNSVYTDTVITEAWPLMENGCGEHPQIGQAWQRVVVPVVKLLKDSPEFNTTELSYVVFSGDGSKDVTYWISDIYFHVNPADLEKQFKASWSRRR